MSLRYWYFWPKEGRIVTVEVLRTDADKTSLLYIVQSPRDSSMDYYSGILSRTSLQSTGKHIRLRVDAKTLANRRHLTTYQVYSFRSVCRSQTSISLSPFVALWAEASFVPWDVGSFPLVENDHLFLNRKHSVSVLPDFLVLLLLHLGTIIKCGKGYYFKEAL